MPKKTLRDEFAMSALIGMLSDKECNPPLSELAERCYLVADYMLKEKSKNRRNIK